MNRLMLSLLAGVFLWPAAGAMAQESSQRVTAFTVHQLELPDPKPVFATVESTDVTMARTRIGGTLVSLTADEGVLVKKGDVLAVVADDKLALQITSSEAQIAAAQAESSKAQEDLQRGRDLFKNGTISKAKIDELQARADVAANQLKAQQSAKAVLAQQVSEGKVLSPSDGRVLTVPVTQGAVVMPGETVARIAADHFILRLKLPERHARVLKADDIVTLAGEDVGSDVLSQGRIAKIYPEIDQGRVLADVSVEGLSDYFVGERVRVWITTDKRQGFVVPLSFVFSRGGSDYVRLQKATGETMDVPVQKGQSRAMTDMPDGVEILSGLQDNDVLVKAEN